MVDICASAWVPNNWRILGYAIASDGPLPPGLKPLPLAPRELRVFHNFSQYQDAGLNHNTCSCKFLPTVFRSMRVVMPSGPRTAESPMPESCNNAGVWIAPAAKMTSRLALAVYRVEPPAAGPNSTPEATSGIVVLFVNVTFVTCGHT